MTTLTDRYVTATVRHVGEKHRGEIERELRAAIADDVDARVALGETPADAEYAALREFGNPARLAARYAPYGRMLIGPQLYPDFVGALRLSCWSVLSIVYAVLVIVLRAHGENAVTSIVRPIGITMTVAMYLVVGVTALFALVDHQRRNDPRATTDTEPWTPDQLAVVQPRPARWSELIGGVVLTAILVAALFVQRGRSPVTTANGTAVPIIDPALWDFWIPYFLAVIALALALKAVNIWRRRWNLGTAIVGTLFVLACTGPLGGLFWRADVLNHALTHGTGALVEQGSWIAWLAVLVLALCTAGYLAGIWRNRDREPQ